MSSLHRNYGYDFVRAWMILIVFWAHAVLYAFPGTFYAGMLGSISPGLTMSMLAFLSGLLVSEKGDTGDFILRRGLRIFIPVWSMATLVILVTIAQHGGQVPIEVTHPHTLLHAMGLTAFGVFFGVENQSVLGHGLWFITAIFGLYLWLPAINKVLRHPNRTLHLVLIVMACYVAHRWIFESESLWNVVIGFVFGVYIKVSGNDSSTARLWTGQINAVSHTIVMLVLLGGVAACTIGLLPIAKGWRDLAFVIYPVVCFPWLMWLSRRRWLRACRPVISYFAMISFEFYLVHFYLIYDRWLPSKSWEQLSLGFIMSVGLAAMLYHLNTAIAQRVEGYLSPRT